MNWRGLLILSLMGALAACSQGQTTATTGTTTETATSIPCNPDDEKQCNEQCAKAGYCTCICLPNGKVTWIPIPGKPDLPSTGDNPTIDPGDPLTATPDPVYPSEPAATSVKPEGTGGSGGATTNSGGGP